MKSGFSIAVLLLCLPLLCLAKKPSRHAQNSWWLNVPHAPIIFDYEPIKNVLLEDLYKRKYWFGLRNRSSKPVSSYSLGCVVQNGRSFTIVNRWFAQLSEHGHPHNAFWNLFEPSYDPVEDQTTGRHLCTADSKLALVQVDFVDFSDHARSSWIIPGAVFVEPGFR